VARLGRLLARAEESLRWQLIAEFLEEYRWEPAATRFELLAEGPASMGHERWDVFLAALAEHLAARDGRAAPDDPAHGRPGEPLLRRVNPPRRQMRLAKLASNPATRVRMRRH
jgi:hypothetical protein